MSANQLPPAHDQAQVTTQDMLLKIGELTMTNQILARELHITRTQLLATRCELSNAREANKPADKPTLAEERANNHAIFDNR